MAEASVSPCPSAKDNMAAKQPPPLMKKHSQTDLVSRLKTRKILGVGGEDDDGEVHRSKVGRAREGEEARPQACWGLRLPRASRTLCNGSGMIWIGAAVCGKNPVLLRGQAQT